MVISGRLIGHAPVQVVYARVQGVAREREAARAREQEEHERLVAEAASRARQASPFSSAASPATVPSPTGQVAVAAPPPTQPAVFGYAPPADAVSPHKPREFPGAANVQFAPPQPRPPPASEDYRPATGSGLEGRPATGDTDWGSASGGGGGTGAAGRRPVSVGWDPAVLAMSQSPRQLSTRGSAVRFHVILLMRA